jgi:hypothetical protein
MGIFGWSYPPGAENDPFAPYNQDYGEEYDEMKQKIVEALKGFDSGRWDWEKIDCTITWKDADLDSHGQQGIQVIGCDDDKVTCLAHIGKTFVGEDVCLNEPNWLKNAMMHDDPIADRYYEAYREAYLETATDIVCGCVVAGEWDGDDWYMYESVEFSVPWEILHGTGEMDIDYNATAAAIVKAAEKALEPLEKELILADEALDVAAGWRDFDGNRITENQDSDCAAWCYDGFEERAGLRDID